MERRSSGFPENGSLHDASKTSPNNYLYDEFLARSEQWCTSIDSAEFASKLDSEDSLKEYRSLFHYPKKKDLHGVNLNNLEDIDEECIYLCGQSLGLQLKSLRSEVNKTIDNWAIRGVDCHFSGGFAAVFCDQYAKESMASLVGAEKDEIAFMNGLTVNIHLMLATFYRPTKERNKILMVDGGFHSDWYALQSHVTLRGYNPQEVLILVKPKQGKYTIDPDDILSIIKEEGKNIALIYFEAVHFYTGQLFDLKAIAEAGHEKGCIVGYDLAHAVGNVNLQLHDWNVDFAVWCTYKYLNSGPGNMGAIFCHSKHTQGSNEIMPMLSGWWGLDIKKKFTFSKDFTPAEGADRFRLSNPPPILLTMISANIDVFVKAGMSKIQEKQRLLTGYLEYLLRKNLALSDATNNKLPHLQIITPNDPGERGSQLSLLSSVPISTCEMLLKSRGIVCDIRSPSVLRITPAPLYNTFTEVYKFVHIFKDVWETIRRQEINGADTKTL